MAAVNLVENIFHERVGDISILVIDDDNTSNATLTSILEKFSYKGKKEYSLQFFTNKINVDPFCIYISVILFHSILLELLYIVGVVMLNYHSLNFSLMIMIQNL